MKPGAAIILGIMFLAAFVVTIVIARWILGIYLLLNELKRGNDMLKTTEEYVRQIGLQAEKLNENMERMLARIE